MSNDDFFDLKEFAKEMAQEERERIAYRPRDWPPERFVDYSFEPSACVKTLKVVPVRKK